MSIYTYLIGWSSLNVYYYGVRTAARCRPESDLWIQYKTSSEYVKQFTRINGEPDVVQVRQRFDSPKKALLWEHKTLRRMNVMNRDDFLNKSIGNGVFTSADPEVAKKISESCKGRTAHNKGKPNPAQSERMKKNNPNADGRNGRKLKGRRAHNKKKPVYKHCMTCWDLFRVTRDKKSTCSKSCAGTFSNYKRYIKRLGIKGLDDLTTPRRAG